MAGRKRRRRSLAGLNLYQKGGRGTYYWRRTDPNTGRRPSRSTGTSNLELALRKAAEFEEEWERRKAGLPSFDGWRQDLGELAEEWVAHQEREGRCSAPVLQAKRFRIRRALKKLGLRTLANLADVARLHDKVMALEGKRVGRVVATKAHLRSAWQEPLKQFSSWLAENGRCLEADPLACWKAIPKQGGGSRARRSLMPGEMAQALVATDWLDHLHGREHPTRIVWTVLLVCAGRAGALVSRDMEHFDQEEQRIDLGKDVGNKRRGAGLLDPATTSELAAYLDGREEGALLLSSTGTRMGLERLLDRWREAVGLGLVWELWPEDEPWTVEVGHQVNRALIQGRPSSQGGNPKRLRATTKRARRARERFVLVLADGIREEWERRMQGVDVHAFRMTHRTWALAQGVPEVLIDKQLGHAPRPGRESMDILRVVEGSRTGRKHYLDMRSALLEAGQSAAAVRELLDEALSRVVSQPGAGGREAIGG